ncbi:MAG: tRNA-uridine aminocarboxypropyltransferase [Pseudobdellovibrionaceae bacterium]
MENQQTFIRKRKTKDPCPVCFLNRSLCICELFPQLDLKTRVCLVIHAKELKRTTNTGRLALKCLPNSEMRVRGDTKETLDLSNLLRSDYRTLLFYPSNEAVELNQAYVDLDPRPIQLIVPDGNWRQASKVHYRHHELKNIPRVMIKTPNPSKLHLRAESTPEGMATLQAIAHALGIIEGANVKDSLLRVYDAKLERTLQGRGHFRYPSNSDFS